jgi:hypothetical protein
MSEPTREERAHKILDDATARAERILFGPERKATVRQKRRHSNWKLPPGPMKLRICPSLAKLLPECVVYKPEL